MKIKSVLLIGLSAVALASCGSFKNYKTQVRKETFDKDLENVVNSSVLFDSKNIYSFEETTNNVLNSEETWFKNGKAITKQIGKSSGHTHTRFDSKNLITRGELQEKYDDHNDYEHTLTEQDVTIQEQADSKAYYYVNVNEKLFTKTKVDDPKEYMTNKFKGNITASKYVVQISAEDDGYTSFYEDKNVFTIEHTYKEEDKEQSYYSHYVMQVVINENGYESHYECETESTSLNYKKTTYEKDDIVLRRKDNLNLKALNLDKFLEIDKIPSLIYPDYEEQDGLHVK